MILAHFFTFQDVTVTVVNQSIHGNVTCGCQFVKTHRKPIGVEDIGAVGQEVHAKKGGAKEVSSHGWRFPWLLTLARSHLPLW